LRQSPAKHTVVVELTNLSQAAQTRWLQYFPHTSQMVWQQQVKNAATAAGLDWQQERADKSSST